jgi:tetratricopeptide (TPR) repeat protein
MPYNHLKKINVFNLTNKLYTLSKVDEAYDSAFNSDDYTGIKPYIEVFLIDLKKDIPLGIAIHRTSRILDSSKFQTALSSEIDGFNIYLTCFNNVTSEYLSWLTCKSIKHVEILLNKERYAFLENKDELAKKRIRPQKEAGISDRAWKKQFKDRLSIEIITSQFAKNITGLYFNQNWKKEKLFELYNTDKYNPLLIKTKEGDYLMKTLDLYELHIVENYKRVFFKQYYNDTDRPDDEEWLRDKAWRLFKLGYFRQSLEVFSRLTGLNQHNEEYYRIKGITLFYLKEYQKAIEALNKAIFVDPSCAESWYAKANCFYKLQNYQQTLHSIDKAIGINYNSYHYYCLKGMSFFNIKDFKNALDCFNSSLKINPQQAKSWCLKGYCQLYTMDFDGALKSFDKSLTIKQNYVDAILGKAFILKRQEKYTEALEYFDRLQKIKPDDNFICKSKRECILAINKVTK